MSKRPPKPLSIPDVMALITTMAATADILSLPEDWLQGQLISTAHMRDREVAPATVRSAIEFWKEEHLQALHWQQIEARLARANGEEITR